MALSPPQLRQPIARQTTRGFLTPHRHHLAFSAVSSTPCLLPCLLCLSLPPPSHRLPLLSVTDQAHERDTRHLLCLVSHISSPAFPPVELRRGWCDTHAGHVSVLAEGRALRKHKLYGPQRPQTTLVTMFTSLKILFYATFTLLVFSNNITCLWPVSKLPRNEKICANTRNSGNDTSPRLATTPPFRRSFYPLIAPHN